MSVHESKLSKCRCWVVHILNAVATDYVNFRYMITLLSVGCLVFHWATVKRMLLVIFQLYFLKENEFLVNFSIAL